MRSTTGTAYWPTGEFTYYVLEGGFFVTPKLELALRYSQMKDNDPYYDFLAMEDSEDYIAVETRINSRNGGSASTTTSSNTTSN